MAENIKPSEVSEVLRRQLAEIDTTLHYEEIGTVLQVSDGVARIYGLRNAEANELLEFDNGMMAIAMNLEEDNVGAVLLGPTDQIKEGFTVKRTGRIASIQVGMEMLGRVINPLGQPLDGKGEIGGERLEMPLERKAPGVIYRQPVNTPEKYRILLVCQLLLRLETEINLLQLGRFTAYFQYGFISKVVCVRFVRKSFVCVG